MDKLLWAPSILSADFGRLAEQVAEAEGAGADWLHLDVMDGHFVPNISFGVPVVAAVRRATELPLDVHLMIEQPERYLAEFAAAGATSATVHVEACRHLHRAVQQIREHGMRAGVALNPATPLEMVRGVLPDVDLMLVMSVNPGFGGQSYIPSSTAKIAAARELIRRAGCTQVDLQVDGGVSADTVAEAAGAGANVLVAGSAVFNARAGVAANLARLREAAGSSNG